MMKSSRVSVFKGGTCRPWPFSQTASTDCFSMTSFGKELQSVFVRAIKLCWSWFWHSLDEFRWIELPSALNNIY